MHLQFKHRVSRKENEPETDLLGNDRFDDHEIPNTGAGRFGYFDIGGYGYVIACEGD